MSRSIYTTAEERNAAIMDWLGRNEALLRKHLKDYGLNPNDEDIWQSALLGVCTAFNKCDRENISNKFILMTALGPAMQQKYDSTPGLCYTNGEAMIKAKLSVVSAETEREDEERFCLYDLIPDEQDDYGAAELREALDVLIDRYAKKDYDIEVWGLMVDGMRTGEIIAATGIPKPKVDEAIRRFRLLVSRKLHTVPSVGKHNIYYDMDDDCEL